MSTDENYQELWGLLTKPKDSRLKKQESPDLKYCAVYLQPIDFEWEESAWEPLSDEELMYSITYKMPESFQNSSHDPLPALTGTAMIMLDGYYYLTSTTGGNPLQCFAQSFIALDYYPPLATIDRLHEPSDELKHCCLKTLIAINNRIAYLDRSLQL